MTYTHTAIIPDTFAAKVNIMPDATMGIMTLRADMTRTDDAESVTIMLHPRYAAKMIATMVGALPADERRAILSALVADEVR